MGLREQKKKKSESRILAAMDSMLSRKSVDDIAMADIARLAKVSVGTLYNYFESKDDLIFCYSRARMQPFIARAQDVSDYPPQSGERAILAFLDAYLEGFCSVDRSVISHVMRVSMQQRLIDGKRDHYQRMASGQLCTLVTKLQAKGLLDPSTEPVAVSLVLFSIFSDLMFQYSNDESLTLGDLRDRLRRCVGLVFEGLRKRPHKGVAQTSGRRKPGHPQEVSQ
jgi:AcrR family transcriptional regulator